MFEYVAIAPDFNARWLRLQGTRLKKLGLLAKDGASCLGAAYLHLPVEVRGAVGAVLVVSFYYAVLVPRMAAKGTTSAASAASSASFPSMGTQCRRSGGVAI